MVLLFGVKVYPKRIVFRNNNYIIGNIVYFAAAVTPKESVLMQRKLSSAKNIIQKIQFIDHSVAKLRLKSDLQHEGPVSLPLLPLSFPPPHNLFPFLTHRGRCYGHCFLLSNAYNLRNMHFEKK